MKKILIIIMITMSLFLTGCFEPDVDSNENKVIMHIGNNYAEYMPYDEVPTFEFSFDGVLNTSKNTNKPYNVVFTNNEDIILSDAINELFTKYADSLYIETVKETDATTTLFSTINKKGKIENIDMVPDDKKTYDETAYVSLDNGLKLTIDYRRFVCEGKNYYSWRYSYAITFQLYYPLMVVKENNQKRLLLITLPNTTKYMVGPQLKLSNILNDSTYLESNYYSFKYPEFLETKEEKIQYVQDYYVSKMQGVILEDGTITYNYLGFSYKIELLDNAFKMYYLNETE